MGPKTVAWKPVQSEMRMPLCCWAAWRAAEKHHLFLLMQQLQLQLQLLLLRR